MTWYLCSCVILFPWVWTGDSVWQLTNKILEQWWCHFSRLRLWKDWFSRGLPSLTLLLIFSRETNCHVVSCPMERPTWQRTEESSKLTASKELGSSVSKSMRTCMLLAGCAKPGSGFSSQLAPWQCWGRGTQPSCVWILDHGNDG